MVRRSDGRWLPRPLQETETPFALAILFPCVVLVPTQRFFRIGVQRDKLQGVSKKSACSPWPVVRRSQRTGLSAVGSTAASAARLGRSRPPVGPDAGMSGQTIRLGFGAVAVRRGCSSAPLRPCRRSRRRSSSCPDGRRRRARPGGAARWRRRTTLFLLAPFHSRVGSWTERRPDSAQSARIEQAPRSRREGWWATWPMALPPLCCPRFASERCAVAPCGQVYVSRGPRVGRTRSSAGAARCHRASSSTAHGPRRPGPPARRGGVLIRIPCQRPASKAGGRAAVAPGRSCGGPRSIPRPCAPPRRGCPRRSPRRCRP